MRTSLANGEAFDLGEPQDGDHAIKGAMRPQGGSSGIPQMAAGSSPTLHGFAPLGSVKSSPNPRPLAGGRFQGAPKPCCVFGKPNLLRPRRTSPVGFDGRGYSERATLLT